MVALVDDKTTWMYGPFIITAHNAMACIKAGDNGDPLARRVMWGINTWLSSSDISHRMGCVCRDCPTSERMFSKTYQPAAFLVMLPLRDEDQVGMILAACVHCFRYHADDLQSEMEYVLQSRYPEVTTERPTLH